MQDSEDRESAISFRTRAAIAVAFILATVVVAEGLAAGGGVRSSVVDPGIPLGPGLLATRSVFHGPHVRMAAARIIGPSSTCVFPSA